MEPGAAHDGFHDDVSAVKGYLFGVFGLVGREVTGGAYGGFCKYDGQRCAELGVRDAAQIVHTQDVVGEGGAGGVRVVAGPWRFRSVGVCEAEDLEGFEERGEGYLKVGVVGWVGLVVFFAVGDFVAFRRGGVVVVGGEEGFVEEGGCCCASEAALP